MLDNPGNNKLANFRDQPVKFEKRDYQNNLFVLISLFVLAVYILLVFRQWYKALHSRSCLLYDVDDIPCILLTQNEIQVQ